MEWNGVEWAVGGDEYQLSVAENPFYVAGLSPNIRRVRVASTGASARSLVSVSVSDARVLSHSAVLLKTPQSYQELKKKRAKQTNEIIQTPRKSPLSDARFRLRAGCSSSNEKRKKRKPADSFSLSLSVCLSLTVGYFASRMYNLRL